MAVPVWWEPVEQAVQRKNYGQAVKFLESEVAIAASNYQQNPQDVLAKDGIMQLLYTRAPIYFEMGDLKAWRGDCSQMVKMAPTDSRGYIRLGKLLSKNGNYADATRVYQRGLARVSPKSAHHDKLSNELTKVEHMTKRVDPLMVLPPELWGMVLDLLSPKKRIACLRVSSLWKQQLEATPRFWDRFDLTSARSRDYNPCFACIRRAKGKLKEAVVTSIPDKYMVRVIRDLKPNCKTLESLALHAAGGEIDSIVTLLSTNLPSFLSLKSLTLGEDCAIRQEHLARLLNACPQIETANFYQVEVTPQGSGQIPEIANLPKLQSLSVYLHSNRKTISYGLWLPLLNLSRLSTLAPNLQRLRLRGLNQHFMRPHLRPTNGRLGFDRLAQLRHLEVINCRFICHPSFPESLEILKMDESHSTSNPVETKHLPLLMHLSLRNSNMVFMQDFPKLFCQDEENPHLLRLDLCSPYPEADWLKNLGEGQRKALRKVERLSIGSPGLDDDCLEPIVETFTNLAILDAAGSKITGVTVKGLVTGCQHLRRLVLNDCQEIYPDAIQWARGQGIEVECKDFPPGATMLRQR